MGTTQAALLFFRSTRYMRNLFMGTDILSGRWFLEERG